MDKSQVIEKLKEYKSLISKHFEVEKMYLFGSYAKDNNTRGSDINVAIVVKNLSGDSFDNNPLLWKLRREIDSIHEHIPIDTDVDISGFLEELKSTFFKINEYITEISARNSVSF